MPEFVIEVPHSPQECSAAASEIARNLSAFDLLATIFWGCSGGAHIAWIVGQFDSEREATRIVPMLLRDTARVVRAERGARPRATPGGLPGVTS